MTTAFHRPRDAAEALTLLAEKAAAPRLPLAGGTQLNSLESRNLAYEAVALEELLPRGVAREGATIVMGAACTFQEILDAPHAPAILKSAARGMVDRNIRNRATVGGNLGADKSCSSLVPVLLAVDAGLELLDGRRLRLEDWLALPAGPGGRGVISRVLVELRKDSMAGYARWARVSCDLSVLGAAASFRLDGGRVRGLRLVLGGVAPHARRAATLEAAFEGRPLPSRDAIEAMVAGAAPSGSPHLSPIDDERGSAAFKRSRIAALVAEALLDARPIDEAALAAEVRR